MKLVIFDIDGVILRGLKPIPDAPAAVGKMREKGIVVSFLTNNSSRTTDVYAQRLINAGIPTKPDEIMSSAIATALYLTEVSPKGARIFVVGEEGIITALTTSGFTIVGSDDLQPVDYVVVGFDRHITYEKLARAQKEIWCNGAKFIGTNHDPIFPVEDGGVQPGGGAIVYAIEACTKQKALIIGKPEPTTIELLLKKHGVSKTETMIVGDNLDTDILAGKRAGIATAFVLTGIHNEDDLENAPRDRIPDFILRDLSALENCIG